MSIGIDVRLAVAIAVVAVFLLRIAPYASAQQMPEWRVVNVAHRGGIVSGYPENTLAAYRRAISLKVDVVEIDLRGTRDGEVVVLHDETLDRTTNGKGKVTDLTLRELKELDAGGGEKVPTYEEVLELVSRTGVKLLLDVKVSPVLDRSRVVRLTEQHGAVLDVIAGVRTLDDLREFRQLNPNIRTLGFVGSVQEIEDFIAAGVDMIRLMPKWIQADESLIERVQQMGKPVWTTAFDAPREQLEQFIRQGVNGILSDFPEVMADILKPN